MPDFKTTVTAIAIFLTVVSYVPYVRDIFKGKTKPHVFSWLVWSIINFVVFGLQVRAGAGVGAWTTLVLSLLVLLVLGLSLKYGSKVIKKIDVVFLALAFLAIPLWLAANQPILSVILLVVVDVLAFLPTVHKSWTDPYSETLSMYAITTIRFVLSAVAVEQYNLVTLLYPVTWVMADGLFTLMLIVRRRSKRVK